MRWFSSRPSTRHHYNKLKLVLLEKGVPFRERLVYPWQRDSFLTSSPLGKIPFVETEHGSLSESQVILEYLEDRYPESPLYARSTFARAKCRELIQHLELNAEWVARRLYKERSHRSPQPGRRARIQHHGASWRRTNRYGARQ
jgi:glutathione S-transferase